jgi:hypothetical protein
MGWVIMVPGQSLVLYSRLHLISSNYRLLRIIFWTIVTTGVVLCVPTVTLNLRQYTKHPQVYTRGYVVMEKIQLSIFTAQEAFISLFYFWEIRRILLVITSSPTISFTPDRFNMHSTSTSTKTTRKSMWQLVAMNVLLLILDVVLLTVEFQNFYMIQTTFKSLVYSTKLKVEFAVLSQIKGVMKTRSSQSSLTIAIPVTGKEIRADDGNGDGVYQYGRDGGDLEAQITQGNLPPEWRLNVGDALTVPRALSLRGGPGGGSPTYSLSSVERMYPGKLTS